MTAGSVQCAGAGADADAGAGAGVGFQKRTDDGAERERFDTVC